MARTRGQKKKGKTQEEDDLNAPVLSPRASIYPSSVSDSESEFDWWENFSTRFSGYTPDSLFRVSRKTFEYICGLVEEEMMTGKNYTDLRREYLILNDRVAIALTRLCTGETFEAIGNLFTVSLPTACQIIWRFVEAIEKKGFHHLHWPQTEEKITDIKSKFEIIRGLQNCCGAIDTTKIMFCLSSDNAQRKIWCDEENNPCMILQAVVDPYMRFLDISAGLPGCLSQPDALYEWSLFNLCEEGKRLNGKKLKLAENNEEIGEYIVGNGGFPLLPWLLTPYNEEKKLSEVQQDFNKRLHETSKVAKMAFERLKQRCQIIQGVLRTPDKLKLPRIIYACCVLHNIMIDQNDAFVMQDESFLQPDDNRPQAHQPKCKFLDKTASVQRDNLALYLSSKRPPFYGNGIETDMDAVGYRETAVQCQKDRAAAWAEALQNKYPIDVPTLSLDPQVGDVGRSEKTASAGGAASKEASSGGGKTLETSSRAGGGNKRKTVGYGGTASKVPRTEQSENSDKSDKGKSVAEKSSSEGEILGHSGRPLVHLDNDFMNNPVKDASWRRRYARSIGDVAPIPSIYVSDTRDILTAHGKGVLNRIVFPAPEVPPEGALTELGMSIFELTSLFSVGMSKVEAARQGVIQAMKDLPKEDSRELELKISKSAAELRSWEMKYDALMNDKKSVDGELETARNELKSEKNKSEGLAGELASLQTKFDVECSAKRELETKVANMGEAANQATDVISNLNKEIFDLRATAVAKEKEHGEVVVNSYDAGGFHVLRILKRNSHGASPTLDESLDWMTTFLFDKSLRVYHPEIPYSDRDLHLFKEYQERKEHAIWDPPAVMEDNLGARIAAYYKAKADRAALEFEDVDLEYSEDEFEYGPDGVLIVKEKTGGPDGSVSSLPTPLICHL